MMTNSVHPNEVLKALLAKGIRRDKQEKLRKLNDLCALEYSRHNQGARDLTLSNMSKMAEIHGLFKARTIYNAQSEDYATLINTWDSYSGPKESQLIKGQTVSSDKYPFLKKIEDSAVRSLCQLAFVERDKVKAELNLLKSKTQVIVDMRPLGAAMIKGSADVAVIEMGAQLTDSEREALIAAIDLKVLTQRKWRLGDTGEVLDERGRFVFMPGFASGIAKILGKG